MSRWVNGVDVTGGRFAATGRDVGSYQIGHSAPPLLGPENNWHYFHPGRVDVIHAPDYFLREVKGIDERLDIIWHPVKQRWACWAKDPYIKFPMCAGWNMIFPWEIEGRYMPLDNRLLAMIYNRSPRVWGSAKKYWQRIEDEILGDKRRAALQQRNESADMAADYWDYRQIKVAMRGQSSGSKFSESHS